MVNGGEVLFADVAMLRVDVGGGFSLPLFKVPRSKNVGGGELGFAAQRSNSGLEKHGIGACGSLRRPFARGRLHPAPPRNRVGSVSLCDGAMKTLPLLVRYAPQQFVIGG